METQKIEDQIFALFTQLPAARQAVLVDTLSFATEEDDIEVEIIDDDDWNKEEELKPLDLK